MVKLGEYGRISDVFVSKCDKGECRSYSENNCRGGWGERRRNSGERWKLEEGEGCKFGVEMGWR